MAPRGLLPPLFGLPWEQGQEPAAEVKAPSADIPAKQPAASPDEPVLVMRRRGRDPTWLKPYRERMAKAARIAAEQTKHLKGPDRVRAMNQVVRELMKVDRGPAA